jgi:hypothetical protein
MKRRYSPPINIPPYKTIVPLLIFILVTSGLVASLAFLNLIIHYADIVSALRLAQPITSFSATRTSGSTQAGRQPRKMASLDIHTHSPSSTPAPLAEPATEIVSVINHSGSALVDMPVEATSSPLDEAGLRSPTATPSPILTPIQTRPPSPPTPTPLPSPTPLPEYDFTLAEFFNSPTTNSFILIYVAIVDAKDIPIGDMKIVGTRLDHNLTYESPLSTWYYEGYSAPGEVVKSGNVKFEPPGAIETTSWTLYLADLHGNRLSADIPFDMNENDKQWYFIKFRRSY